jgi:hypothetical protein
MAANTLPGVTPLEGATTVDEKLTFEPDRLSYRSAGVLAREIAKRCASRVNQPTVVIAGAQFLADLANLQACYLTLDDLKETYHSLIPHSRATIDRMAARPLISDALHAQALTAATAAAALLPTPVAGVAAAVNAALGIAALFRQNVTFSGRQTKVDELAFEVALAADVKSRTSATVYLPDLMVLAPLTKPGSLHARLLALEKVRFAVWQTAGPLVSQLVLLEGKLAQAVQSKDQAQVDSLTAQVSDLRRDLDPLTAALDRSDRRLSELQAQWANVDQNSQMSLLARLLRAEALKEKNPIYLHAQIVSSGGYVRTTRSLLSTIFTGDGVSFQGGVVVRWALLDRDGSVQDGGILTKSRWADTLSIFETETTD